MSRNAVCQGQTGGVAPAPRDTVDKPGSPTRVHPVPRTAVEATAGRAVEPAGDLRGRAIDRHWSLRGPESRADARFDEARFGHRRSSAD